MDKIAKILMNRDGYTKSEAVALIKDVLNMMEDAISCGNYIEAEDIFMDELGLEPDYIFYVL